MASEAPDRVRYHSLDALRAAMMLLGIVVHVAASYTISIPRSIWPFKDINTSVYADLVVFSIHSFRMPLFFVMAGFFTALLRQRHGITGMLKNRASRVLVPMIVFWIVLMPLAVSGVWFAVDRAAGRDWLGTVRELWASLRLWEGNTLHLWFLYYLVIFYLVATVLSWAARTLPSSWIDRTSRGFRRVMAWRLRMLILAIPTAIAVFPQGGEFGNASSFLPPFWSLVTYLTFFGFGWALHAHRELLQGFIRNAWTQTFAGMVLFIVLAGWSSQVPRPLSPGATMVASGFTSVIAWLLLFGITGIALRYLERPSRVWRYLTDSAYWCYLIHLPLVYWVGGLFARIDLPAYMKIAAGLAIVIPLALASYHLLVRSTFIGTMLNGKRYTRKAVA